MRLTSVIAIFTAVAVTSVAAYETNAQRFARGLPPNPPARRGASNTDSAEHHHPSKKPHHKHHGDGDDDGNGDDGHDGHGTHETNGQRLARGLPPNPPVRRDVSGTDSAHHHHPSGKPHHKHHGDDGDDGKGDHKHHGDGGDDDKGDDTYETNAKRFARGLPPNPPVKRGASGTDSADHHHPSGKPHHKHHGDGGDDDKGDDSHDGTYETNAKRLARGLPPNPPVRRAASNTDSAEHHHPSEKPHHHHGDGGDDDNKCKTGAIQCCNSVSNSANPVVKTIAGLAKAKLPTDNIPIGLGCSAMGEHSCSAHTVCCENNGYSGVIAIGCTAINISA